jgi:hypothetical protein
MSRETQTLERTVSEVPDLAPRGNVLTLSPPPPMVRTFYSPKMVKSVLSITREIGAVEKAGWNDFHKYKYLKWDDVLDRLSVLLPKHGLLITPSEVGRSLVENDQAKNDQLVGITYEFVIVNEDGEEWPMRPRITAFGRVRDSKNICDDKAAVKCLTQAEKYFLIHFFKIRTSDVVIDSDADGSQIVQQDAKPKPPKPGSAEAKALTGPRTVTEGADAAGWADAFLEAIKDCTAADYPKWIDANGLRLEKLKAYPEVDAKVQAALKAMVTPVAKPPKPPKPGATQAAAAPVMPKAPDAATDPVGWIKSLREKMAGFKAYEDGEAYWNDHVQALDLEFAVQEEAMSVWQAFERRFE